MYGLSFNAKYVWHQVSAVKQKLVPTMVKKSSTQVLWPQVRSILFLGIREKN